MYPRKELAQMTPPEITRDLGEVREVIRANQDWMDSFTVRTAGLAAATDRAEPEQLAALAEENDRLGHANARLRRYVARLQTHALVTLPGNVLLRAAAMAGDIEGLVSALAHGASLASVDNEGYSALHLAAAHNQVAAAEFLLRAGIDVDIVNHLNQSPLHIGAVHGHVEVVTLLLAWEANCRLKDNGGHLPRDLARLELHHECVDLLGSAVLATSVHTSIITDIFAYPLMCESIGHGVNPLHLFVRALSKPSSGGEYYVIGERLLGDQTIDYTPYFDPMLDLGPLLSLLLDSGTSAVAALFEQLLMLGYTRFTNPTLLAYLPGHLVRPITALLLIYAVPLLRNTDMRPWLIPTSHPAKNTAQREQTARDQVWSALLSHDHFGSLATPANWLTLTHFLRLGTPAQLYIYLKHDPTLITTLQDHFTQGWIMLDNMQPQQWAPPDEPARFTLVLNLALLLRAGLPLTFFTCHFHCATHFPPDVLVLIFHLLFTNGWAVVSTDDTAQTNCRHLMGKLLQLFIGDGSDSAHYLFLLAYLLARGPAFMFMVSPGGTLVGAVTSADFVISSSRHNSAAVEKLVHDHQRWCAANPDSNPAACLQAMHQGVNWARLQAQLDQITERIRVLTEEYRPVQPTARLLDYLPAPPPVPRGAKYQRTGREVSALKQSLTTTTTGTTTGDTTTTGTTTTATSTTVGTTTPGRPDPTPRATPRPDESASSTTPRGATAVVTALAPSAHLVSPTNHSTQPVDVNAQTARLRALRLAGTMLLRELHVQYNMLMVAAHNARNAAFFVEQGHFYRHCAQHQTITFAQQQLYTRAVAAYEQAMVYDPLIAVEGYEACQRRV